jgi:NADH:ubiquinone oxidoreductase subunit 5 (subunit L)/multisubunit Na+/H+ antiporter MnhA subunit
MRMFTALLLALVVGMGSLVLLYANRNLRFEAYRRRFTVVGGSLVAASAALVVADDLLVVAAAWVATSILTVALIETGPADGTVRRAVRARRSFAIGDAAVLVAVGTLVASSGSTSLDSVDQAGPIALAVAGTLLVVAAAARCASGPFVRWLPDSLGAPTPSSALLHAGVVNGGAILLIKVAPATAGTLPAAVLAVAVGAVTCAIGLAVGRTRPDVKGQLAWSTIAQMSFTLVLCGLGLHIAAGLHLVAHGFFKGTRFLGSGGTVRQVVRARRAPLAPHGRAVPAFAVAGLGIAGIATAATLAAAGADLHGNLAVAAVLAWFATGSAMAAALPRTPALAGRSSVVLGGCGLLVGYLLVTLQLEHAVSGQLSVAAPALSAGWTAPVLVALCLVAAVHARRTPAWAPALGRATRPRTFDLPKVALRPARRRPPAPPVATPPTPAATSPARPRRPQRPALAPRGA